MSATISNSLIDALDSQVALLDLNGVIVETNHAWRTGVCFLGMTKPKVGDDLLAGLEAFDGDKVDEAQMLVDAIRALLAGTEVEPFNRRVSCAGTDHWQRVSLRAFTDHEGQDRLLMTCEDITAEQQVDRALLDTERRYQAIVEGQTELICRFLPDTTLTFVNDVYCRYFGLPREELLGRRFVELLSQNERGGMLKKLQSLTPAEPAQSSEHRGLNPDGNEAWYAWTDRAFFDEQGQVTEYQAVGRDVTHLKKTEIALLESRNRFDELADHLLEVFWIFDCETRRITYVSPAFSQVFGRPQDVVLNDAKQWIASVHPDDQGRVQQIFRDADKGIDYDVSYRILQPDGTQRWIRDRGHPVTDQAGRVVRLAGLAEDITDRREVQELFEQFTTNTSTIFWVMDWQDSSVTYVSPAFESVFGHSSESLYEDSKLWSRCVHPEDQERVYTDFPYAHERPFDKVYRIIRRDGQIRYLRDRTFPVKAESGPIQRVVGLAEDVTDRVEADEIILRSEERYRAAAEGSLDAFFLFEALRDSEGEIIDFIFVDVNERGAEMVSRTRDQVIGQRLCELLPVNRQERFFGKYREVVLTQQVFQDEFEISAAEEGIHAKWMQRQVVPVGDGIAITSRDITERKENELELLRQREENQTILDAIPAFVFYKDAHNRMLRVNRAVCEAQGLTASEIEGKHTAELYPDQADAFYQDDLAVIRSGQPKLGYVERLTIAQGGERWIRTDKVPLYDSDKKPAGVIVIAMDVTELQQTAEKLKVSEERFRELFERVPVGVVEQDLSPVGRWFDQLRAEGVEDIASYIEQHPEALKQATSLNCIRSMNQTACKLLEVNSHEELTGSICSDDFFPNDTPLRLKLGLIWNNERAAEVQTQIRTSGDRLIDVLLQVAIPEVDGRLDLTRVMLSLTDISANRQRLFAQAQVAQAENERKRLAHELHDTLAQQLAGIKMLTKPLRGRLDDQSPEAHKVDELTEMLTEANGEVRRLISGLTPERVASDEIENALESLASRVSLIHEMPVDFHCSRAPHNIGEDTANHLLLIAQEAAHNAAKHAKASRIQVVLDQSPRHLTLVVRDDGIGLPPEDTIRSKPGSGLGLGIMRHRAEAIGATIAFTNPPNGGAEVRCLLPTDMPLNRPQPETGEPPTTKAISNQEDNVDQHDGARQDV